MPKDTVPRSISVGAGQLEGLQQPPKLGAHATREAAAGAWWGPDSLQPPGKGKSAGTEYNYVIEQRAHFFQLFIISFSAIGVK